MRFLSEMRSVDTFIAQSRQISIVEMFSLEKNYYSLKAVVWRKEKQAIKAQDREDRVHGCLYSLNRRVFFQNCKQCS